MKIILLLCHDQKFLHILWKYLFKQIKSKLVNTKWIICALVIFWPHNSCIVLLTRRKIGIWKDRVEMCISYLEIKNLLEAKFLTVKIVKMKKIFFIFSMIYSNELISWIVLFCENCRRDWIIFANAKLSLICTLEVKSKKKSRFTTHPSTLFWQLFLTKFIYIWAPTSPIVFVTKVY